MSRSIHIRVLGTLLALVMLLVGWSASGAESAGEQPTVLRLQGATFDPLTLGPSAAGVTSAGYVVVQFAGPVRSERLAGLERHAEIIDYLPDYAYLVRADAAQQVELRTLDGVRWVGAYPAQYKLSPLLARLPPGWRLDVDVLLYPHARAGGVEQWLLGRGAALTPQAVQGIPPLPETRPSLGRVIRAELASELLRDLAALPEVRWVEPAPEYRLANDVARGSGIMRVEAAWDRFIQGAGQLVAITDSGLDTGDFQSLSPDFAGRIQAVHALGPSGQWGDKTGHGTHTAGSLAGNGALSGSDPQRGEFYASYAGMAPEARLVVQAFDVQDDGTIIGLPADLARLLEQAYADGARAHSNSWGGADDDLPAGVDPHGVYGLAARQVDDYGWRHPDSTVVFAAGNEGSDGNLLELEFGDGVIDLDSLLSPGTAKNVITVGASENLRPPGSGGISDLTWGELGAFNLQIFWPPIFADLVSDQPGGMAAISSRGPTDDGRIKPDLVAPGVNIISAASHHPEFNWQLGSYGRAPDNEHYVFSAGTSMSAPMVAGAAVLVRQWLEGRGVNQPSAALIKALLLNGARDMSPGQYGSGSTREINARPDPVQGWGRVDIAGSLFPSGTRERWFVDQKGGLHTGSRDTYSRDGWRLTVRDARETLSATLVWTDYRAAPEAARQLVNDLDLVVIGPDQSRHYANRLQAVDRINNVESVDVVAPGVGDYVIQVVAHNVPRPPQPYALVVAGGFGAPPNIGAYRGYLPHLVRQRRR